MYRIRNAENKELAVLTQLFQETLLRVNSRDYTPQQIEAWGRKADKSRWEELFASSLQFMVAETEDQKIVGFTSINSQGYLHSMFVDYRYQRQGIARLLLTKAEEYARRYGATVLSAEVSITALPFFEKQGYIVEVEQKRRANQLCLTNYWMAKNLTK